MHLLKLGKIVNTHGIKGEVRIQSLTNHAENRYQKGQDLIATLKDGQQIHVTVASHRVHKLFDLVKFVEFPSINEAEALVHAELFIDAQQLPETVEDEFYIHEIIGMTVITETHEVLGTLHEVLVYPANDVWVVQRSGKKDLLLPAIKEVIKAIDFEQKTIVVHLMEGLDADED
ncbi:ribosome maturation factor RimM [Allofustis seminis]|uniref:ribosome maturation factor RimM n=1 Tax=Allofustis seminis TaxID=166939 RepID=UPI00036C437F|nr:ribosome maturation factor RimM [Allofustis seminis]